MVEEEKILTFRMTDKEAKAYRLALLWISLTRKFLPNDSSVSVATLPKGDPRKGYLFKQCWKLLRETSGLLEEQDYKYYFAAQLAMLKNVHKGEGHAHVSHNVFVGEKAWVRWKVWKYKFDQKVDEMDLPPLMHDEDNSIKELIRTKVFLQKTAVSEFNLDSLKFWLSSGSISLVYIGLSPKVKKLANDPAVVFNYDPSLLEKKLTPRVQDHFQEIFGGEYE
tara:strand:+ start:24210 stop:24875 length:666 start_codon:yes stop_codon:yes gene_type:complete